MEQLSLTPATQAVLDALTDLGQGDVHELADKSGKARSTTDKAIKTLADAGVIVAVDPDADPAEGTPARWTLATPGNADTFLPADAAGETEIGDPDPDDTADHPHMEVGHQPTDAVHGSDAETDRPDDGSDAAVDTPDTETADQSGSHSDSDDATEFDGATVDDADPGEDEQAPIVAVVQAARPGDRKVMAIKGVLADYGDIGATLDLIVGESGISHPTASRLLTAMEQADAARRLPGLPQRWIAGPTKASEVDPNPEPPRCPLCYQVIRGLATAPTATAAVLPLIRPDGTLHVVAPDGETHVVTLPRRTPPRAPGITASVGRGDATANADGSQPFGRGELEKLTLDVLAANPGRPMSPQDIATAISGQLGRAVSSGAVRNNCTKAAAAGRILLVSDAPLTFTYPAQSDPSPTGSTSAHHPDLDDNDADQS
ncbi:MarR family transcriptional regulator [Micromonospora sp. WMMD1155]|uniref:MarR family transcriptional regulator n=1 Tax=Micromonospora sp. WMMD1155 TaxID=3016094 RepID=UPI00249C38AC|nr:MarR family transcriptional regulator [Micromonospora sp. WMMD1155]WFE48886.1 MarR family transcriptional regulator [Micromonospora sp. WMMD1155]